MAERMAARIWIGGTLSAELANELCRAIAAEGVSLEWGGGQFTPRNPEDLLQARAEHNGSQVLRLCDDQASWGEFNDLESFLWSHAIPYTRQTESGGGYNGESVEYRPGSDPVCVPVDANGSPTADVAAMRRVTKDLDTVLEQLDAGTVREAARQLRVVRKSLGKQLPPDIRPLPNLEITSHQLHEENHGR